MYYSGKSLKNEEKVTEKGKILFTAADLRLQMRHSFPPQQMRLHGGEFSRAFLDFTHQIHAPDVHAPPSDVQDVMRPVGMGLKATVSSMTEARNQEWQLVKGKKVCTEKIASKDTGMCGV